MYSEFIPETSTKIFSFGKLNLFSILNTNDCSSPLTNSTVASDLSNTSPPQPPPPPEPPPETSITSRGQSIS